MSNKKRSVLVVDDVNSIRLAIKDSLGEKYNTFDAESYDCALEILKQNKIDLIITDIRMPGKSGIELIQMVQKNYPKTLYALMTAYNINDYIQYANEFGIWNIIPKYSSLDLKLISIMVDKLFTRDIFGIEKYFDADLKILRNNKRGFEKPPENSVIIKTITSDRERNEIGNKISKYLISKGAPKNINQIFEELTSNAMIRAPKDSYGEHKFQKEVSSSDKLKAVENVVLSENDYFEIGYGVYKNKIILVISDNYGTLKKEEILRRLNRHITLDENGLPAGIADSHGRGLYICREISDHLVFNIKKNYKTEVLVLIDTGNEKSYKGLSIYEID